MIRVVIHRPNFQSAVLALLLAMIVGIGCNLKTDEAWKSELADKKLSRASSSGSFSDKVIFYFCPDGEYAMQTQTSGFSAGGAGTLSMADEDVEFGRWTVSGGSLLVQPEKGERREISLSSRMDQDVIELNGDGYLVETHSECK